MSESNRVDIASLHHTVLRETEGRSLSELDPGFYRELAGFIGDLRRQEFDGVESKIKDELIGMATELTSLLIRLRLDKVADPGDPGAANLLDEEKFILDSREELAERTDLIFSAVTRGKSKLLESISEGHKARRVVVRLLRDVDELVGADMQRYGPFKAEDIATIPYENAQALISKDAATKVRLDD